MPTVSEDFATISRSRLLFAEAAALSYQLHHLAHSRELLSPIDYLHSMLDSKTLGTPDSWWIARYNEIVDAYLPLVGKVIL